MGFQAIILFPRKDYSETVKIYSTQEEIFSRTTGSFSIRLGAQYPCIFCLCGDFHPTWYFFTHMETITDQGPQMLTYTWHWWFINVPHPLCNGSSVYSVISVDLCHSPHTCWRTFGSGADTICFNAIYLSRQEFELPTLCMRGELSKRQNARRTLLTTVTLSQPVSLSRQGFEIPTLCMRGESLNDKMQGERFKRL